MEDLKKQQDVAVSAPPLKITDAKRAALIRTLALGDEENIQPLIQMCSSPIDSKNPYQREVFKLLTGVPYETVKHNHVNSKTPFRRASLKEDKDNGIKYFGEPMAIIAYDGQKIVGKLEIEFQVTGKIAIKRVQYPKDQGHIYRNFVMLFEEIYKNQPSVAIASTMFTSGEGEGEAPSPKGAPRSDLTSGM